MQDFKSSFRVKKSMSMTRMARREDNYNKYYINPEQRYLKKSVDPKKELANLQREDFIYFNLHNDKFNNWRHPFLAERQEQAQQKVQLSEEGVKELIKFKNHLESRKKGRLPALVSEFI
jgi:myo-inositol-hexaphosphate 3-phosphohydrolase